RIGEAAAYGAEELPDRVQQVFRHARPLQDDPHEGKERDGQQRVVVHDAVDAFRVGLQERPEEPDFRGNGGELDAEHEVDEAAGRQREGYGVTEKQHQHHAGEHQQRKIVSNEIDHDQTSVAAGGISPAVSWRGSSIRPVTTAKRLMISEKACSNSSANPSSTTSFAGQMVRPPALEETSPELNDSQNHGQAR